jgi:uncharacterized membrane protein (UPF0127 family)
VAPPMLSREGVYRVTNDTRGSDLAVRARAATTIYTRFMGLMGRDALPEGEGLIIRPCNSIHSFFMRFPFDAVFVDGNDRVVHTVHEMRARRGTRLVRGAKYVVELPAGTLRRTETQTGDRIVISPA